jgi:hypothetical protein
MVISGSFQGIPLKLFHNLLSSRMAQAQEIVTSTPSRWAVGLMIKTDEVSELVCSGREPPFRKRVVKSAMYQRPSTRNSDKDGTAKQA